MHYFKRNIGDYHKKAGKLSMLEHGAYTLLLDSYYDRERPPTKEDAIDWTWARTPEEVAAVEFVLGRFFTLDGDVYRQKRIDEEIEKYKENAKINKRIAQEREARRKQEKERSEHEACTKRHLTTNHKPLTINQVVGQNKNRFAKPTLDEIKEYCKEKNYFVDAERFINFYESKGWMIGKNKMKSWKAAVSNWAKTDKQEQPKKPVAMRELSND